VQHRAGPIVVDVRSWPTGPVILDALVRLQLAGTAISGHPIRLENACPELVDLLALVGLSEVLPACAGSGLEIDREIDGRSNNGNRFSSTKKSIPVIRPPDTWSA